MFGAALGIQESLHYIKTTAAKKRVLNTRNWPLFRDLQRPRNVIYQLSTRKLVREKAKDCIFRFLEVNNDHHYIVWIYLLPVLYQNNPNAKIEIMEILISISFNV